MLRWLKRLFFVCLFGGIAGAIVYGFLPKPVPVDVARVTRGTLSVTVNEDGKTRLHDRYVISAPLAGRLHRIKVRPGDLIAVPVAPEQPPDSVVSDNSDSPLPPNNGNGHGVGSKSPQTLPRDIGESAVSAAYSSEATPFTELAVIEPSDPALLDSRQIAQAELKVKAVERSILSAGTARERASLALEWAKSDLDRRRGLTGKGASTKQDLEDAELLVRTRTAELNAAKFAEEISKYEFELAQAALLRSRPISPGEADKWQLRIRSPIDGVVLKVFQESETIVQIGTPLLEVGDPRDLEVEIDVLSSDAVKIRPGQTVWLKHWGGERPLSAHVRLVEPQGFLKLSALGVEEQRVHVIAQFDEPYSARPTLGDGYRVEAEVVIWEKDDVVKVPTGALFREGNDRDSNVWAVFIVDGEVACKRTVKIGRRSGLEAEVLEGLLEGEKVIVHPSDRIADQKAVAPR